MNKKEDKFHTILVIVLGLLVFYYFNPYYYLLLISITFVAIASFSSNFSRWVHFCWMKFALLLNHIAPNILLSLIYFLVLFPIAFLSKKIGRQDYLNLKNNRSSMFADRYKTFSKDDLLNPW